MPPLAVADLGVVEVSGDPMLLGVAGFEEEATAGLCDSSMDVNNIIVQKIRNLFVNMFTQPFYIYF